MVSFFLFLACAALDFDIVHHCKILPHIGGGSMVEYTISALADICRISEPGDMGTEYNVKICNGARLRA